MCLLLSRKTTIWLLKVAILTGGSKSLRNANLSGELVNVCKNSSRESRYWSALTATPIHFSI